MRKFLAAGALLLTVISTASPAGIFGPAIVKNPFTTNSAANTPVSIGPAPRILSGGGDPEGSVTANLGSLYLRTNATGGLNLYSKTNAGLNSAGWWPIQGGSGGGASSGTSTNLAGGNMVWVDAVHGSDTTGARTNAARPFLTVKAAKNAAIAGDTLYIRPGTYNEFSLLKDNVNLFLEAGARLTNFATLGNGGYGIFDDRTNGPLHCTVSGFGSIWWGANASGTNIKGAITITNPLSRVVISMNDGQISVPGGLGNQGISFVHQRGGTNVYNFAQSITSANLGDYTGAGGGLEGCNAVYWSGGDGYFRCPFIYVDQYAFWGDQPANDTAALANWWMEGDRFQSQSGASVLYQSGTGPNFKGWFRVKEIENVFGSTGVGAYVHGKFYLEAMKITVDDSLGDGVQITGGNAVEAWITAQKIQGGDTAVSQNSGTLWMNVDEMFTVAGGRAVIDTSSGTNRIRFGHIHAISGIGVLHRGGESTISGGLIETTGPSITNVPVWLTSSGLMLRNVSLRPTGVASNGIISIGVAQVTYDGIVTSTRTNSGNLTVVSTATNYVGSLRVIGDMAVRDQIAISGSNTTPSALVISATSNTYPQVKFQKSRGGEGAAAPVLAGDPLGNFDFAGWDGSAWRTAFRMVPSTLSDFTGSSGETIVAFTLGRNSGTTRDAWYLTPYTFTNIVQTYFQSNVVFELATKFNALTASTVLGLDSGKTAVSLSGSGVLDLIGSTRGAVLYRGASGWVLLVPGTSGQFLQTAGAGADPLWATATGSLADGDKGDITVTGSGATWTIDNGVVTYAKIQNVSATQRVLARNTAGAGVVEEVTASQILDWISSTRGVVLYRGSGGWAALSPGTSGQLLQTAGAGADPLWVTSGTLTDSDKGDITVTGSGATWTVDAGAITYAKIVNGTARSVLGRSANSSGVLADIQAASDGQVLRQSGSALSFGALDLAVAAAVTGILPKANLPTAVAYEDEANTFTLEQSFSGALKLVASAISASDIDWALGPTRTKTLAANTTFTFSNLADDRWIRVFLTQDATGGRTVTWPAGIVWMTSTNQSDPPVVASIASAVSMVTLERSGGTVRGWYSGPDSIPLVDIASITGWAKGDLIVWDGGHSVRLARGTDGQHLISSNGAATGVAWVDVPAGGSGSTQMVVAAAGNLTMTNQITYIPLEYNGSNTVNNYAWDMSLNTFKPVTNFVNTNMVFTLSNITKSASLISEFIGNPGTTNTILIQATSGVNIKWKGWNTNNNGGGIYVRGGYSYTFQAFADRATNVSAWVTTDDPYAVGPIISIVTNDLVINTRYTNTASTVSYVQCSMTLNASVTDIAQAVLLIDQNGDGTWDAWITNRIGSGVAMADSILMGGWVTNSGIFLITNQSTGSATATINPNSSQRISGFGTGPQGLTGATGATGAAGPAPTFNSLPQAQTNYLPTYDRRMAWGKYDPSGTATPVNLGALGAPTVSGTLQANQGASETNSVYGIIRATTAGVIQASINPGGGIGLFVPTNRVFLYTATVGFSNAPGTNEMHMEMAATGVTDYSSTLARIGWFAATSGTSFTNWVAQFRSNNTAQITVHTSTARTDQWHTLGIGNTNGNTLVWYMDGVPVASLANSGIASPGGVGAIPSLGMRVDLSPNGTNFMFWQDFELLYEKTLPVSTGPL